MKAFSVIAIFLILNFFNFSGVCAMDSIPCLEDLSLDEKIGQLIMLATISSSNGSSRQESYKQYARNMIREYGIGGVIFLGAGTPADQVEETNNLQALSKYPLLIGLDAEWGLAMRHQEHALHFPRAMVLGALSSEDDYLIRELGQEIGRQCKELGTHINFAPVVDVNNNPRNPIINTRSFGEDPEKVAQKALLFIEGLKDAGVLSCAKHFPGHGDTVIDTHHERGIIHHDETRLHAVELLPFKRVAPYVDAIMTAHLDVPALAQGENVPATLSRAIVTSLLREKLCFNGLIITDSLGMRGVTNDFESGELELRALKAGNDILLCPIDIPNTINRIKQAISDGEISQEDIDLHVNRILSAKRKVIKQSQPKFVRSNIFTPYAQRLKEKLYQSAVTMVRDNHHRVPLSRDKKISVITFGRADSFVKFLKQHIKVDHIPLDLNVSSSELDVLNFDTEDQIVVSLHLEGRSGMIELQISENTNTFSNYTTFINKYASKAIFVLFGNPYNLANFSDVPTVIVGYENEPEAQSAVAATLLGMHTARGILPVTPLSKDVS